VPAFDPGGWLAHPLAILTGVALLELGCVLHAVMPPAGAEPAPAAAVASPNPRPDPVAPKWPPARLDAILARPLFTPGRTPARPERAPSPPSATPPRLAGLIVTGDERRAIFASAKGERPVVVGTGGRLGPFTVTAIDASTVELAGPDGVRTLRPATDADLRSRFAYKGPIVARIDPIRRERETESDQ